MTKKAIKHGTPTAYRRHGCRCDVCCEANRDRDRDYWRRRGRLPRGNPCEKDGVIYPNQAAAARALGVSKSAISLALSLNGDLSRIGKSRSHGEGGKLVPIRIGGREWPSRAALIKYLGLPAGRVRGWIRRRDIERLMVALITADARESAGDRRF